MFQIGYMHGKLFGINIGKTTDIHNLTKLLKSHFNIQSKTLSILRPK